MALASVLVKVYLAFTVASLTFPVAAQGDVTVTPEEPSPLLTPWKMALVIETAENAPYGSPYDIFPLTQEAGQVSDVSKLPTVNGDLVALDYTNFTQVDYNNRVVFLSCDSNTAGDESNMYTPDRIMNTIMSNASTPSAILLYSTVKPICYLGGFNAQYTSIWTMANWTDAAQVRSILATTPTDSVKALITHTAKADENQQNPQNPPNQPNQSPGSTSSIAMSILYSITGLITLLFLLIIATGAVRAHRNPERYGPRASVNGRPRRSRARGIAMAMLETLPIVKFGESDQPKPDEETALENTQRANPQPREGSQVMTGAAPENEIVPESSSEAASNAASQSPEPHSAPAPASASQDQAKKEPEPEADHLGCSICTEDFTVGEDVRVLPCDHKFHPTCVDPWLVNVSGTCPLCRLDLRPPEDIEAEENDEPAAPPEATAVTGGHLAPPPAEGEPETTSEAATRRRRSRLLDWNRLRHASVDERLQALRQYRQSQQSSSTSPITADDQRRHSRLTRRLRDRFHIRTDLRTDSGIRNASLEGSLPPASTRVI